ncbi:13784_t:CDS:2, partial [Funneliformis mosseae]
RVYRATQSIKVFISCEEDDLYPTVWPIKGSSNSRDISSPYILKHLLNNKVYEKERIVLSSVVMTGQWTMDNTGQKMLSIIH